MNLDQAWDPALHGTTLLYVGHRQTVARSGKIGWDLKDIWVRGPLPGSVLCLQCLAQCTTHRGTQ